MEYTNIGQCEIGDIILLMKDGAEFEILRRVGILITLKKLSTGQVFPEFETDYPKVYRVKTDK